MMGDFEDGRLDTRVSSKHLSLGVRENITGQQETHVTIGNAEHYRSVVDNRIGPYQEQFWKQQHLDEHATAEINGVGGADRIEYGILIPDGLLTLGIAGTGVVRLTFKNVLTQNLYQPRYVIGMSITEHYSIK